jgi:ribosomal protein L29
MVIILVPIALWLIYYQYRFNKAALAGFSKNKLSHDAAGMRANQLEQKLNEVERELMELRLGLNTLQDNNLAFRNEFDTFIREIKPFDPSTNRIRSG